MTEPALAQLMVGQVELRRETRAPGPQGDGEEAGLFVPVPQQAYVHMVT
jgi:hypothetical protein